MKRNKWGTDGKRLSMCYLWECWHEELKPVEASTDMCPMLTLSGLQLLKGRQRRKRWRDVVKPWRARTAVLPGHTVMAQMEEKWAARPGLAHELHSQQPWVMPTDLLGASWQEDGDTSHTCSQFFNPKCSANSGDNSICVRWGGSRYDKLVNEAYRQNDSCTKSFLVMTWKI